MYWNQSPISYDRRSSSLLGSNAIGRRCPAAPMTVMLGSSVVACGVWRVGGLASEFHHLWHTPTAGRKMERPHSMPNFPPRRWVAPTFAEYSPNVRSLNIRELWMPLLSMAPRLLRKGTHHAINARGAHIVNDMGRCTSTPMFFKRIMIGCQCFPNVRPRLIQIKNVVAKSRSSSRAYSSVAIGICTSTSTSSSSCFRHSWLELQGQVRCSYSVPGPLIV